MQPNQPAPAPTAASGKVPEKVYVQILVGQEKALHEIAKPRITLGLQEQNDVVLSAEGISNFHAELFRTDEGWQLKDLGSTNGTYVNGQRIALKTLANKDKIIIGKVLLRFGDQKPVPPRMALYVGVGAILIALLAGSFLKDAFSKPSGTGEQSMTPEQQARLYNDMMEKGLKQFEEKDYDSAKRTFHAAKKKFASKSAPNNMLRLTEIFADNPNPATFPWEKMKGVLNDLSKETPETDAYKQFVARELSLIDKDRAAADFLKIIFAKDATDEDKFRVLDEAGKKWPDSRVYQLFRAQLVPIGAKLVKKYFDDAQTQFDAAQKFILEEKWVESGESYKRALDLFEQSQTFDVNKINKEIPSQIQRCNDNLEAFQQFMDGLTKIQGGQKDEAQKSLGLVRFGNDYHTPAQNKIQGLRLQGEIGGIVEKYVAGEIDIALTRLRSLKEKAKEDRELMRDLTRLESKLSRIERAWLALKQASDAKDYRTAIEQAQMIDELERDYRSGNHYLNEATRIQSASRRELDRIFQEAMEKLTTALKESRFIDVPGLIEDAMKKRPNPKATDVEDRVRDYMKPLAKDLVSELQRMKLTGKDATEPEKYKNLKFGAQLVIDTLSADPELTDTVEKAKKALGQR